MAASMHDIIKQQILDLREKGYSLARAGQILETIDRADKGRNLNEIKRVVEELKTTRKNPKSTYSASITPTEHDKKEWSRMAQAAYAARLNSVGHKFSGAASIPKGAALPIKKFDELQKQYRAWLIDNVFPNPRKKKTRARYKHKDIAAPSTMAKGSIRTKRVGKKLVRVGCPKGPRHYNKKTGRCKVGTRAVSILSPNPTGKTFRVFAQKSVAGNVKYYYWNGDTFDTNYSVAVTMNKDAAIKAMKSWARKYPNIAFGVSNGKA